MGITTRDRSKWVFEICPFEEFKRAIDHNMRVSFESPSVNPELPLYKGHQWDFRDEIELIKRDARDIYDSYIALPATFDQVACQFSIYSPFALKVKANATYTIPTGIIIKTPGDVRFDTITYDRSRGMVFSVPVENEDQYPHEPQRAPQRNHLLIAYRQELDGFIPTGGEIARGTIFLNIHEPYDIPDRYPI